MVGMDLIQLMVVEVVPVATLEMVAKAMALRVPVAAVQEEERVVEAREEVELDCLAKALQALQQVLAVVEEKVPCKVLLVELIKLVDVMAEVVDQVTMVDQALMVPCELFGVMQVGQGHFRIR
jgi:hypothetical protein